MKHEELLPQYTANKKETKQCGFRTQNLHVSLVAFPDAEHHCRFSDDM